MEWVRTPQPDELLRVVKVEIVFTTADEKVALILSVRENFYQSCYGDHGCTALVCCKCRWNELRSTGRDWQGVSRSIRRLRPPPTVNPMRLAAPGWRI
ncbi:MAG: hypothetical protein CMJ81_02755 [Planctomycetaceae bacterium]|nr:hypothetical protein [Planctomycetaceae bacterium]MBP62443.1 hypothetical protein [Planctomycetaceae bacterium]